jgi:hypothetical protein
VTVPVEEDPPATALGFIETLARLPSLGVTVRDVDCEPPLKFAVRVTVYVLSAKPAPTAKLTELAPAGTVTVDGR